MKKIASFLVGVKKEMSRVRWAKKDEMIKYSIAILVCVLIFSTFFVASDVIIAGIRALVEERL